MRKKIIAAILAVLILVSATAVSFADDTRFVTIREWTDTRGECGACLLLVRIKAILNPVLAVAEDETGTVNLFSGNGEDSVIVNFMGDEGVTEGCVMVIMDPKWNEFEGTVEMADWTLVRLLPVF